MSRRRARLTLVACLHACGGMRCRVGGIRRGWEASFQVFGAGKLWRQLQGEGVDVARCTVERLMRAMGIQGTVRGKKFKTTLANDSAAQPAYLVERDFSASRPNDLWVAGLTCVADWRGFVFVAFALDGFARMIVGWRFSGYLHTDPALDALEQALWAHPGIDHPVRVSIRYP